MLKLSKDQAKAFYNVHSHRPFFNELVEFMTTGPVLVSVLEGENAELIEEIGRFDTIDQLDPAGASTVNDLASALNRLGLTTREMTSILQSIKNAGALQAELIMN